MKMFKKVLAVVLVLVMLFSLCGCAELDELRQKQAFFNENGIIYKDNLYKKVNISNNLNYTYTNEKDINVTDPGVPVLASAFIAFNYSMNEDETVIMGNHDGEWYIREDKYPLYEESIKNGINYTDFGFSHYDFDLEQEVSYLFNENEKQAVLFLLSTEPVEPEFNDYYYEEIFLFEQSDNALFRRGDIYSIVRSEGPGEGYSYYLVVYDNGEEITWEVSAVYRSTPQTDALFKSFFEKGDIESYY